MGRPLKIALGAAVLVGLVWFIFAIRGMLAPFGIAFVLAYVLSPLVDKMEGRGLNRTLGILLIFSLAFGGLGMMGVTVGGRVITQISELSNEFLRQEKVFKELILTNNGAQPLAIRLNWENDKDEQPFVIVEPENPSLLLDPGLKQVIRLRFAPDTTAQLNNALLLSTPILETSIKVRVRGNAPRMDKDDGVKARVRDEDERKKEEFWGNGENENEIRIGDLVVSTRGIDFGQAGPNILSSLSESDAASTVQRLVGPYVGEDFDLADFVKVQGRSLLNERLLVGGTTEVLGGVFSGLTFVVIVPFIAFFFMKEGHRFTRNIIELVPNAYFELCLNLLHQINGQIGGYIRGQLLATSVVAILALSGLQLIGMKYAVPLGLLAGFANMIPFLGPLIGIISASIVALATGAGIAMVGKVVVLFLIIQLVDNVVVQPTVVARSVEMHPLMVLFAVMVGSQLMGIVGMLIAVPLFGITKVSAQTIYLGIQGYRTQ